MNATPATHYARTADGVHVAYQLFGDGPLDAVFVPWWWNNVEAAWEEPGIARFYDRLGSFCRLLVFDQRGTGLSDPVALNALPTLEEWMDDLRAVLDAVGWKGAAVIGHGDGGLVSLLFAASWPERTRALVLIDAYPRLRQADDLPGAYPPEVIDEFLTWLETGWGTGEFAALVARSQAENPAFRGRLARAERLSVSPGTAVAIQRLVCDSDLRSILPMISAPTLVIAHARNPYVPARLSRFLAQHIIAARHVELAGEDHLYWVGDTDGLANEIEGFLTGATAVPVADRLLATVVFTDIVGSTDKAVEHASTGQISSTRTMPRPCSRRSGCSGVRDRRSAGHWRTHSPGARRSPTLRAAPLAGVDPVPWTPATYRGQIAGSGCALRVRRAFCGRPRTFWWLSI